MVSSFHSRLLVVKSDPFLLLSSCVTASPGCLLNLVDGDNHGPSLAGDVKFGLIGKLLSPKLATENVVFQTFTNIWTKDKAEIFPLKNGVFLFKFPSEQQLLSIFRCGPWLIDDEPFVMVSFDHALSLNEYDFTKITY
ncbi:hypothetical protein V6N13_130116 [Hibiscus sabdariffa]